VSVLAEQYPAAAVPDLRPGYPLSHSIAVFTYMEQSHNGRSGTACFSGLGRDSFPPSHVEFWSGLPSLVSDGWFFFRINVGSWHPYLAFLYPARSYEDLNEESGGSSQSKTAHSRAHLLRAACGVLHAAAIVWCG
jgi:hypothetical protein